MRPQRRLTRKEAEFERAKAERAHLIVSMAQSDKDLMKGTLEGYEQSERGEGRPWEEICRERDAKK